MTASNCLRIACIALSALAIVGAGLALTRGEPYLASRLAVLFGAAAFASVRAEYIVTVSRERPGTTLAVAIALGLVIALVLTLFLFPDQVGRFLAWAAGNPNAKTP